MHNLTAALVLGDVAIWPYHAGQPVVDVVLFLVWAFLLGVGFTLGARVLGKLL